LSVIEQAGGIVFRGHDRDVSILLVTSKKVAGTWIFPKGHVEPGETDAAAALRETREEAGVDGELLGPVGEPLDYKWRFKRYRVQYFLIRATSEFPANDGRTIRWLPFDEAVARLSDEGTRRLLEQARPGMIRGLERPDAGDA
jgi:diadenosine hexaphosphate hydrolase (ATP-forming)